MSNQKQTQAGGNATLSIKVSSDTYDLLNILAEGLQHGTNANDLLKMFVHAFIESARHYDPVNTEMQEVIDIMRLEPDWHKAFNIADPSGGTNVAQAILVLQQPGHKGFGLVMIDKPFMPGKACRMTYCVDDILERVTEVAMKGLYRQLRQVGLALESNSLRETLTVMCDAQLLHELDRMTAEELPGLGDHTDFGRAINEYGNRAKAKQHRTPDSLASDQRIKQATIHFADDDREAAESEASND
jgi:hypothetical protein